MIDATEQQRRDDAHEALVAAIDAMQNEQREFRAELRKNSELTAKINEMTEEMVDLFAAAKGAFKVLGWIGTGVKWIGGVAAALGALWVIFKGGFPPK